MNFIDHLLCDKYNGGDDRREHSPFPREPTP